MPRIHQTTPFRRPTGTWSSETPQDPAEVGTAFGLELCLEQAQPTTAEPASNNKGESETPSGESLPQPPLCP
jgi:hypothetical protein